MRGASRKKQNSLINKEMNSFECIISHALSRFKLDMWYDMLSQLISDADTVTSLPGLQELVQSRKQKLKESGDDPAGDLVVMYFRDFFRDVGQLRRMKDVFHVRIYSVLFEYFYDVDAIQEISDVAKTQEEESGNDAGGDLNKSANMSKLKEQNLSSQIYRGGEGGTIDSQFSEEVVSELADDCIQISSIIGELKRLVFTWGNLLNDPVIDITRFTSGIDEQFKDYDNYQHFESVFKFIPDILGKSHQAIVLARNWWYKAEKIQRRINKIPAPVSQSRQVSAHRTWTVQGQHSDHQEDPDEDEDDEGDYADPDDLQESQDDLQPPQDQGNWDEEDKPNYSDELFDEEDDIMEDFGEHGDLSDEDDIFQTSDPGAIVIEKNKTPGPDNNTAMDNNIAQEQQEDIEEQQEHIDDEKNKLQPQQQDRRNRSRQRQQDKKAPQKSKPVKERKEFGADPVIENDTTEENNNVTPTVKLRELNANIDAHQRELDTQIEELQNLCERNQRVKALCEQLEDTIGNQITQRKKAQELMTVKESLEELSEQKTTSPAKRKKIDKHLDMIHDELEGLLQSGKLREYQNELLKEDLELQLAVSPTLVS